MIDWHMIGKKQTKRHTLKMDELKIKRILLCCWLIDWFNNDEEWMMNEKAIWELCECPLVLSLTWLFGIWIEFNLIWWKTNKEKEKKWHSDGLLVGLFVEFVLILWLILSQSNLIDEWMKETNDCNKQNKPSSNSGGWLLTIALTDSLVDWLISIDWLIRDVWWMIDWWVSEFHWFIDSSDQFDCDWFDW